MTANALTISRIDRNPYNIEPAAYFEMYATDNAGREHGVRVIADLPPDVKVGDTIVVIGELRPNWATYSSVTHNGREISHTAQNKS